MEANSTTISIVGILKWLLPSLVGSALAVWFKRNDVSWKEKGGADKFILSMIAIGAIIVGVIVGLTISNIIITYTGINEFWYQFGIHLMSSLTSLKVIDAFYKNTDEILKIVVDGIKKAVQKLIDKLTGG